MPLAYTSLDRENMHTMEEIYLSYLRRKNWSRAFIDEYFDWQFLQQKEVETVLALDDDRCVAMIHSSVRPYAVDGVPTRVRETDFWISEPEYRPFASFRVLQTLMARPEPICAVTVNDYVTSIFHRLKWQQLPEIHQMVLPVRASILVKAAANRMLKSVGELPRLAALPFRFTVRPPKRIPAPSSSAAVREILNADDIPDIVPPADGYCITQLTNPSDFDWYAAAPKPFGDFVWLEFSIGGKPVAYTISRIYPEGPCFGSKIFHVQSAVKDPAIYGWILSETSAHLAKRGSDWIDARFSCPLLVDALRRIGFMTGRTDIAFWWPGKEKMPEGQYLISVLYRGEGLAPYPV